GNRGAFFMSRSLAGSVALNRVYLAETAGRMKSAVLPPFTVATRTMYTPADTARPVEDTPFQLSSRVPSLAGFTVRLHTVRPCMSMTDMVSASVEAAASGVSVKAKGLE